MTFAWRWVLGFYVASLSFIYMRQYTLPTPVQASVSNKIFSEERAVNDLRTLVQDIGIRPLGTQNAQLAKDFLLQHLLKIQANMSHLVKMEIDVQQINGARVVQKRGVILSYKNITNIVVKLTPVTKEKRSKEFGSLLVSSHYDSAIASPGAFDDGVPVVVMLEVLSNIVNENTNSLLLKHDIIFLFNDGEEVGLLGSSAFIKHHKWANDIKVFMNLEAAGSAGKAILFQSTNAWVMNQYANVMKHPKGNVVAQDIFDSGIIPSDTDYRIYSTELRLGTASGLDTAFYLNGYHYHSHMDNIERIDQSPGSIQSMGDNTLAFVRHFGYLESELVTGESLISEANTKAVFFDIFGYTLISYGSGSATIPYILTFIVTSVMILIGMFHIQRKVTFFRSSFFINFGRVFASILLVLLSFFMAVLIPYMCSILIGKFLQAMSFYAISPYFIFALYGPPALCGVLVPIIYFPKFFAVGQKSMYCAVWILWTFSLGIGAFMAIGSTYQAFVVVLSLSIGYLLWGLVSPLVLFFVVVPVPTLFMTDMISTITEVFVPLMGRMNIPSDTGMAGLVSCATFLLISLVLPFVYDAKKSSKLTIPKWSLSSLFMISVITIGISSILIFPYSPLRPKRIIVQHIFIHNEIEFVQNGTQLPLKYIDSYLGLGSDDIIQSTFVEKHSKIPYKFEYSTQTPLFTVPSQGTSEESKGFFVHNTRLSYINESSSMLQAPEVSVKCNNPQCGKLIIKIANKNDRLTAFSHELVILSLVPIYDSSFGDILNAEQRVQTMVHPSYPNEKMDIYRSRIFLFHGSPEHSDHTLWVRFAGKSSSKEKLLQISVKTLFVGQSGHTREMNKTLEALPNWVAPIPCVGTFRIINFLH